MDNKPLTVWWCCLGEQPLQVARCTKIISADTDDPKYIINVKQFAKFVVDLSDQVAPTDIEEGMRVGWVVDLSDQVAPTDIEEGMRVG